LKERLLDPQGERILVELTTNANIAHAELGTKVTFCATQSVSVLHVWSAMELFTDTLITSVSWLQLLL